MNTTMSDDHPSADDYRNRVERAEQALAERDAEIARLRRALTKIADNRCGDANQFAVNVARKALAQFRTALENPDD